MTYPEMLGHGLLRTMMGIVGVAPGLARKRGPRLARSACGRAAEGLHCCVVVGSGLVMRVVEWSLVVRLCQASTLRLG